jgi:tetratricopeptide (TPR) repeat protein
VDDIFAVQDEVTGRIVSSLAVQLTDDERGMIERRDTEDSEAYDHVLRGSELIKRITKDALRQARAEFERAIELDPGYALAHARLGVTHHLEWVLGYSEDPGSLERARTCAERALELDDKLFQGHLSLGLSLLMQSRHEDAIAELERAVALSPNDPEGWSVLASAANMAGHPDRVFGLVERAMRLDPHHKFEYLFELGHAYYLTGQLEQAVATLTRVLTLNPEFHPAHFFLVASYAELELLEEAHAHLEDLLGYWSQPFLEDVRRRLIYADQAATERLLGSLRTVGIREVASPE